jgi:hypothetical protein
MLVGGDEWVEGEEVRLLCIQDGDRLFESVYRALFGPSVELRHRCSSCREGYELTLALRDLFPLGVASNDTSPREELLPGGTIVHGLCLGDLLAAGRDAAALLARAVVERGSDDEETIASAVERLSSSRIESVETICPHCERPQSFPFDLTSFLLSCCARERPILLREIHLLARTYGWSFADITTLDRTARHELVRLVISTSSARPKGRAA